LIERERLKVLRELFEEKLIGLKVRQYEGAPPDRNDFAPRSRQKLCAR
jgi:hypothetical protein